MTDHTELLAWLGDYVVFIDGKTVNPADALRAEIAARQAAEAERDELRAAIFGGAEVGRLGREVRDLRRRAEHAESDRDQNRDYKLEQEARAEQAEAQVAALREALIEAMGWNWLDEDAEQDIPQGAIRLINGALSATPDAATAYTAQVRRDTIGAVLSSINRHGLRFTRRGFTAAR